MQINALIKRFREPSSYAALTGVLALIGVNVDPSLMQDITTGLAALAGIAGFFLSEKGAE
tara:strand:- start:6018 stop:6197 length:180 start_codon:yes stop_codon:yes gene_type:complete